MSAKELVALRTICDGPKINPREARVKLRAAAKAGKLDHKSRGAWAWEPSKVADVKAIITAPAESQLAAKAKPLPSVRRG